MMLLFCNHVSINEKAIHCYISIIALIRDVKSYKYYYKLFSFDCHFYVSLHLKVLRTSPRRVLLVRTTRWKLWNHIGDDNDDDDDDDDDDYDDDNDDDNYDEDRDDDDNGDDNDGDDDNYDDDSEDEDDRIGDFDFDGDN